ncbi:NAD(P)-dependent dehydrogenase (short-subunit alcohol dehydrogenase family) [Peribacillus frigoritolerans]|nr:NAD(P)-dependent dehydrogenase (short-subunit alcohol dehydrogenase family) [Peribacillus frigoritolerans]
MIKAGGGSIFNTASMAGFTVTPYDLHMVRPKRGSEFDPLYRQYGKDHIRCNGVAPGLILIPATKNNMPPAILDILAKLKLFHIMGKRMISVIPFYSLHLMSPSSLQVRRSKWKADIIWPTQASLILMIM